MTNSKLLRVFTAFMVFFTINGCAIFSDSNQLEKDPNASLTQEERENLKKPVYIQDLAYGEILFDYYRHKKLSALTKILIAQKNNSLPNHKNRAELLSGAIYLDLGMLDTAKNIFDKLLTEKDLQNELLARITFYLNKLHYKEGDFTQAKKGLTKIYNQLSDRYRDESLIMLSNIALKENELEKAKDWLVKISKESEFSTYVRFNLGILWLKNDDLEHSLPFLERVYLTLKPTELQRTLQDRASVALGYYYLKNKQYQKANLKFKQVRLTSPSTNKALLGIGWTFIEEGNYRKALSHWLKLNKKDVRDLAVQEALLAIPYAYQKLDAMSQSLSHYLFASKTFQEQIELVENIQEKVANGNLVENLVASLIKAEISEDGRFTSAGVKDNQVKDTKLFGDEYDYYIYELLAKNSFNEGFRNYQKLGSLALILEHWEKQLPMFKEMVVANQKRYQQRLPKIESYLKQDSGKTYSKLFNETQREINDLRNFKNLHLLANEKQKVTFQRIKSLEAKLNSIPSSMISQETLIKAKRAKGVLMWQLQEGSIAKIWELEKQKEQISVLLNELKERKKSLSKARGNASVRFVGEEEKIKAGSQSIVNLKHKIEEQTQIQLGDIKNQILAVLEKRKATLKHFQLQSDLSIARLNEKAVLIPEDVE